MAVLNQVGARAGAGHVLVVNAGSSSLKVRLLDPADTVLDSLDLGQWAGPRETGELAAFVDGLPQVDAVGHRIVHGGNDFRQPVVIDRDVREAIAALTELAPLHQPRGLAGIDALATVLPDTPAVACFDTAFHATARGGLDLRAARRVEPAVGSAALRVPRPVARPRHPPGGRVGRPAG